MVSKSITRQGRDITMINLTKLADGADNFNRLISNGTNSGHGSLPAGSNFGNSPSLEHAMTGGGHMFTKLWLMIHILAIMGLIGSVMVQPKLMHQTKKTGSLVDGQLVNTSTWPLLAMPLS